MTLEMGKPLAEARGEVTYGAEFLAGSPRKPSASPAATPTAPDGNNRILVQKQPVGPCLLITPWNFPLAMATRKIAPAVAAGCTMVLKPADLTPLTCLLFAQVMQRPAFPAGVLNVIQTSTAGAVTGPLIKDDRLRKISFTGSTAVGQALIREAADKVLRTSMELGGNAPFIVFEDADLDKAVDGAIAAKMRNMGEACTAANRFIVHESSPTSSPHQSGRADVSAADRAAASTRGTIGPLVDSRAARRSPTWSTARPRGRASVSTGGAASAGRRLLLPADGARRVSRRRRDAREEIFGPVAPITVVSNRGEAIRSPTTPRSAWPVTCSPRTWPARCDSARNWRPGCWA